MAITTIRPTATAFNNSVTSTGGAGTPHGNTSDNSDASYIVGTTTGSGVYLDMADVAVAGNQRVKQVRGRFRIQHNSLDVGWQETIDWRMRDSSNAQLTPVEKAGTTSNTVIDSNASWRSVGPGNQTWSQTTVNRLQANPAWRASGGGQYLRVMEIYIDVDINTQPVASAVTVTGATTTTKPTVTWASTDADGDTLTRYRVVVVQQSATTQPGFDPWTASADWDSGQLTGNPGTATVGTSLQNGVTYVAYVWIAQDWPGPQGSLWWSAAANSANFTISLTPPAIPVITATVEGMLPSFRARLEVTDTNSLLTANDSEFETTVGTWAGRTNATMARTTAQFNSGVASASITATAAADAIGSTALGTSGYVVEPGVTYTAVLKSRTAVTSRNIFARLSWYDSAGTIIGSVNEGASFADATNWTGFGAWVTATAPANARYATVGVRVAAAAAAEVHYIDSVALRRGTYTAQTGYALAGLTPTVSIEKWEPFPFNLPGAVHNWSSRQVSTAGAELGTIDGFTKTGALDSLTIESMDRPHPDPQLAGDKMIHWSIRSGAFDLITLHTGTSWVDLTTPRFMVPVVPGKPHTTWGWLWSTRQNFATQWIINWRDDLGNLISSSSIGASFLSTVTSTPQLFSYTATAPAGAVGADVQLQNAFASGFDEVYGTGFGWACGPKVPDIHEEGSLVPRSYSAVRGATSQAAAVGGVLRDYDHEAPGWRPTFYRARSEALLSGQVVASIWSAVAVAEMPRPGRTVFKNPIKPAQAMVILREPEMKLVQDEQAFVDRPLGGTRPIKIRDFIGGHDGGMTINYRDYTELKRLRDLYAETGSLLIQWFDGGQTYVAVVERADNRVRSGAGTVVLSFLESGRP